MKKLIFLLLTFLSFISSFAQIDRKRVMKIDDSLFLHTKWIKDIITSLGNDDSLRNDAIPTAKAVSDWIRTHGGGPGSGVNKFADLQDVLITTLSDRQIYMWDAAANKNVNRTPIFSDIINWLNYTPENLLNKSSDGALGVSTSLYPTQSAVKFYVDAAITALSASKINISDSAAMLAAYIRANLANATFELKSNKSTSTSLGTSDVSFPTQNAVKQYVDALDASRGSGVTNRLAFWSSSHQLSSDDYLKYDPVSQSFYIGTNISEAGIKSNNIYFGGNHTVDGWTLGASTNFIGGFGNTMTSQYVNSVAVSSNANFIWGQGITLTNVVGSFAAGEGVELTNCADCFTNGNGNKTSRVSANLQRIGMLGWNLVGKQNNGGFYQLWTGQQNDTSRTSIILGVGNGSGATLSTAFWIDSLANAFVKPNTTAKRAANPAFGMFRPNSSLNIWEWYDPVSTSWLPFGSGTGLTDPTTTLGDIIVRGSSAVQRLAGNITTTKKYLQQVGNATISALPAWAAIAEVDIAFTDVTTGNASTSKHGYLPKLTGDALDVLHGDGTFSHANSGIQNFYPVNGTYAINDSTFGLGTALIQHTNISLRNLYEFKFDSAVAGTTKGFVINFTTNSTDAGYDMFYRDSATGHWTRLAKGSVGQSIQMLGAGGIGWANQASGFADPLTTNYDIIARISGVTTRFAKGSNNTFLGVDGSGVLAYNLPFTLTTTGTSGAATFSAGVLNIPQYTGGGGGLATSNFVTRETPSGTLNGSNTTFTLANTPTSGTEQVFLNGQLLTLTTDYTISTTTITMIVAPLSTDILRVTYMK